MHSLIHDRPQSQCDICKEVFGSATSLERHRLAHSGEKPYTCGICNKSFTESYTLIAHFGIHTGEQQHERITCIMPQIGLDLGGNFTIHIWACSGDFIVTNR